MPRRDPITGCTVATLPDIIAADAKRKGRTFEEESNDFFRQMAEMEAEDRKMTDTRLRRDALSILQKAIKDYNESDSEMEQAPFPVALKLVVDVSSHSSFRSSSEYLVAECRAKNGKTYRYTFGNESWSGTFYEPPDYDENLNWERVTILLRAKEIGLWLLWRIGQKTKWRYRLKKWMESRRYRFAH